MAVFANTPFDPSTWDLGILQLPTDTPSTVDDPRYTEYRYQIAFRNDSHYAIVLRCAAYSSRINRWTANWDYSWNIHPGQRVPLDLPGIGPLVGNHFRFFAVSTDNTVSWGNPKSPLSTGVDPPYNSTGGFRVFTDSLI